MNEPTFERCPHDRENPYAQISRELIQDRSISPKAKGVIIYILSLPKDWKIRHSHLQYALNIGEDYLNSAMEELIEAGYVERTRERIKGIYQPYRYKIREFKKCSPNRENRPGFSSPENPVLQSKETTSKKKQQHETPAAVSSHRLPEKPKHYEVLDKIDIPIHDKEEITQDYEEADVIHAVKYATQPGIKIRKTLAATIKWACKIKPEITLSGQQLEAANRKYAMAYDDVVSGKYKVMVCKGFVDIISMKGNGGGVFDYLDPNFMQKFKSTLIKCGFKVLEE